MSNFVDFFRFFSIISNGDTMKFFLVGLISVYQMIPLKCHSYCKFNPTCSAYAIDAIRIHGSFKGLILTIKRLLRCNPFNIGGYDPVKEKL